MPPILLPCPGGSGQSDPKNIGRGGDRLRVGGHQLLIVPNAVPQQVQFRLTERNSNYIEVEIQPSMPFQQDCELTLSYARCRLGKDADPNRFVIVEINPGTNEILRTLPSRVDLKAKTVTTDRLDHSSGYAIAQG